MPLGSGIPLHLKIIPWPLLGLHRRSPTFTTPGRPEPIPLEIAEPRRARRRGLLGRTGVEGALLLTPAGSVHTMGMRFPIDVAHLDRKLRVLSVRTMRPGRVGLPRLRARHILEAEAGAMTTWGLRPGVRVTVRDT